MKRLLAVLLFASPLFAATITSITPASGSAAGGYSVEIRGSGFEFCQPCSPPVPPKVFFGEIPARHVDVLETGLLVAVAPEHFPGPVTIKLVQSESSAEVANGFTFTGDVEDGFDRVLLPILLPPIDGAFGSRFVTHLSAVNTSRFDATSVYGLLGYCAIAPHCTPQDPRQSPLHIEPRERLVPQDFTYNGNPGRFVYVPKSKPNLAFNLRVFDQSRSAENFGTELPVVRDEQFTAEPFELLDVPFDPRFRNTLRLYATAETSVMVGISDIAYHVVLRPGANEFEPAFAQFTNFPVVAGTRFDVTILPSTVVPPVPGFEPPRVWGFISVTNNETQLITTITPQ